MASAPRAGPTDRTNRRAAPSRVQRAHNRPGPLPARGARSTSVERPCSFSPELSLTRSLQSEGPCCRVTQYPPSPLIDPSGCSEQPLEVLQGYLADRKRHCPGPCGDRKGGAAPHEPGNLVCTRTARTQRTRKYRAHSKVRTRTALGFFSSPIPRSVGPP